MNFKSLQIIPLKFGKCTFSKNALSYALVDVKNRAELFRSMSYESCLAVRDGVRNADELEKMSWKEGFLNVIKNYI